MKRVLTICLLTVSLGAFAQKAKVTSTYNYLKYGELDEAKEAIDAATENPSTSSWYKTWMFRAQTYSQLATTKDEKFASLKEGALEEAIKAYQKVLTIEDKKNDKDQMRREYAALVQVAYNEGLNAYDKEDYPSTYKYWKLADQVNDDLGVKDTALVYNIALIAEKAGDNEGAIAYLDKCIANNFKGAYPYANKAKIQQATGDVDGALATLKAAREKYPNEQMIITKELEIFLASGRDQEAIENLDAAIANDSSNYLFYYARGTLKDGMGDLDGARADYQKAIDLKPDHFDSYFNLGASYVNNGAKLMTEANNIPTNKPKEYEAAKAKADEELKKSIPFLEKALELDPNSLETMNSLKSLYVNLNMAEKAIEMNKRIQEAQAGTGGGQ
jgi:tetratricopeptide (TPR) repeat protein